ncbi:MAG: hypothetical protein DIU70_005965 [Bacillota bacterium]
MFRRAVILLAAAVLLCLAGTAVAGEMGIECTKSTWRTYGSC